MPLFFRSVKFDVEYVHEEGTDFWRSGERFKDHNRGNFHSLFMSGRFAVCILSCLTALLVYTLGRQIADRFAGLLSMFLYCLSPTVLAHAGLVTTDLSAAMAGLAMVCGILHYRSRRTLPTLVLAGAGFSMLFITKFNAVIFFPFGIFLLVLPFKSAGLEETDPSDPLQAALDIIVILSISWLILCGSYMFEGVFDKPSELALESGLLGWIGSLPDWIRLPAPAAYIKALDMQLSDVLSTHRVYLFGLREPSFWYFPACILFKASLPMLLLFITGIIVPGRKRLVWTAFPALFFILAMSTAVNKQMGIRMVLPALPFMFACGGCAIVFLWNTSSIPRKKAFFQALIIAALVWHCAYALLSYPHYISSFNLLAGGPGLSHHGHRYLADSNLDWGQDWIRLEHWQKRNNVESLSLAHFGIVDPAIYGVTYTKDHCRLRPGYLAVSANLVLGVDPFWRDCYTVLQDREPFAKAGASVWIYRIKK